MPNKMRTEFQTLIRTGKLYQLETADLVLTEARIPHDLQEESVSGLITAMPVDPSPGPGTWWTIRVPIEHLSAAEEAIQKLPFQLTTNPGVWDCSPSARGKLIISIGIWVVIAITVVVFILTLTQA